MADIVDERGETPPQRLAPGHQHVVVIALGLKRGRRAQSLFKPPANPISLDRPADALGYRQTHAGAASGLPI